MGTATIQGNSPPRALLHGMLHGMLHGVLRLRGLQRALLLCADVRQLEAHHEPQRRQQRV